NKIFGAYTKKIPTIDLSLEDYGLLFRMVEHGDKPKIQVTAISKETGVQPTFNTIAEIKGTEKPEEYIILSAHFDSWDGGSGATDNGTGKIGRASCRERGEMTGVAVGVKEREVEKER